MPNRTITALYDTKAAAEDAKQRLAKISVNAVDIHDEGSASTGPLAAASKAEGGIMGGLKSIFGAHEDTHAYAEGLKRGHFLLTAKVEDSQTDEAIRVLESSGAVDFDKKQTEWKGAGWTAPSAATAPRTGDDKIQIVEERLVVGKREVERGGVKVRSYIVETPVHEQVTLRDEKVEIERHPVNRPVADATAAFKDQTLEMRETGEEAVVGKQAFVKEELTLKKEVSQRTEEISDKVRHTEVEVEQIAAKDGKPVVSDPSKKRI